MSASKKSGSVYTAPVLSQFTSVEMQRKGLSETLKRLQAFHKAGLAFVEEGRQTAAALKEVNAAFEEDIDDPELELPRAGTSKLVTFVERITDILRDAVADIEHGAVEPVTQTLQGSLTDTKDAKKEYEAVAARYETAKKKYRDGSKKGQDKLRELSDESDAARIEYERAEAEATETLKVAKISAGVQCLRLFTEFYSTFDHMFATGSTIMEEMKDANTEFSSQLLSAEEEIAPRSAASGPSDPMSRSFLAFKEWNKTYCMQLGTLDEMRLKVISERESLGVTEEQLDTMFCNLADIVALHAPLDDQFETAASAPDRMCSTAATALSAILPRMKKMYYRYAENVSQAVLAVEDASKHNRHFASLVKKSERSLLKATGLGLGLAVGVQHLISVPVRYMPHVFGLLQAIHNACSPNDPGWAQLYDLLDHLRPILDHLKQATAHSDSMRSLTRVRDRMTDADEEIVNPARGFIRQGDITIAQSSNPDLIPPGPAYNLTLLSDIVLVSARSASSKTSMGDLKFVTKIPVLGATISEQGGPDVRCGFKVEWHMGNVTTWIVFGAESDQDRMGWMGDLAGAITARRRIQVFGEELSVLMARPDEAGREVPRFVSRVLKYVEANGLDVEGIYRVSGNALEGARLQRLADSGKKLVFNDALTAASLLRAWLRAMPVSPSVPDLYDEWISSAEALKGQEAPLIEKCRQLIAKLPKYNRFLLHVIFEHMRKVSQQSNINLMNARNLSLIIAPPIFPSPNKDDQLPSPRTFELAELFIRQCDAVFRDVAAERLAFRQAEADRIAQEEADRAARRERIRKEKMNIPKDDGPVQAVGDFATQKRAEAEAAAIEARKKKETEEEAERQRIADERARIEKQRKEETEREEAQRKLEEQKRKEQLDAEAKAAEEDRKKKDSQARDKYEKALAAEQVRMEEERRKRKEEKHKREEEARKKAQERAKTAEEEDEYEYEDEAPICAGCGKEIEEGGIEALDKPWHRTCFVCATCGKSVASGATLIGGKPYCKEDAQKLSSK
eukprot:m51a1_g4551 putative domain containing protein (1022) ;mRNA; r:74405-78209